MEPQRSLAEVSKLPMKGNNFWLARGAQLGVYGGRAVYIPSTSAQIEQKKIHTPNTSPLTLKVNESINIQL